jgi:hypothetical protein
VISESPSTFGLRRATFACALVICLLAIAGCGTQQELSASEVDAGLARLDEVERAIDDGDCARARAAAQGLSDLALTAGGSQNFQDAYRESVDRLEELVATECEPAPTEATGSTGPTESPTPATGTTGGGTPPPDDNTDGDNNGGQQQPDGGQPDTPPEEAPPNDGGVGNPDSGGVRPQ